MHWHAIRQPASSREDKSSTGYDGALHDHGEEDTTEEMLHNLTIGTPMLHGQDEAFDIPCACPPAPRAPMAGPQDNKSRDDDNNSTDSDKDFSELTMPTFSTGMTTFAYKRALRNRIRNAKLLRHQEYDMRTYTPTFVHDCLMLPGSLANIIGKVSAEEIIHRMTPALLPDFHAYVHHENNQPCLLQSANPGDYVQGMVIFGQGRGARDNIHRHHRPHARRVKVQVEIDVEIPLFDGYESHTQSRLRRRRIWAHAWLWSNAASVDAQSRDISSGWRLEEYLATNPLQPMRVEPNGYIGEDYEYELSEEDDDSAGKESEAEAKKRPKDLYARNDKLEPQRKLQDVIHGAYGIINYERSDTAIGWW